jgi:hypothetical protein
MSGAGRVCIWGSSVLVVDDSWLSSRAKGRCIALRTSHTLAGNPSYGTQVVLLLAPQFPAFQPHLTFVWAYLPMVTYLRYLNNGTTDKLPKMQGSS